MTEKPLWETEGDYEEFTYKGLQCRLKRGNLLVWLGYVQVPKGNPYYCKDHKNLRVHGGVIYAGRYPYDKYTPGYWIGFDCAHWEDFVPRYQCPTKRANHTYRTKEFAKRECQKLAEQIYTAGLAKELPLNEQIRFKLYDLMPTEADKMYVAAASDLKLSELDAILHQHGLELKWNIKRKHRA